MSTANEVQEQLPQSRNDAARVLGMLNEVLAAPAEETEDAEAKQETQLPARAQERRQRAVAVVQQLDRGGANSGFHQFLQEE